MFTGGGDLRWKKMTVGGGGGLELSDVCVLRVIVALVQTNRTTTY